MPTDHLAVLEELKARLNAIEFDVACGSLSAAQTFTKVRDAHAAAIALMRGQSEPVDRRALIWLAGVPRHLDRLARLGFHSESVSLTER